MDVSDKSKTYTFDASASGAGSAGAPSNEAVARGYVSDGTVDRYVQGGYQNPYAAAPQDPSYAAGVAPGAGGAAPGADAAPAGLHNQPGYVESAQADGYQNKSTSKGYGKQAAPKEASTGSVTRGGQAVGSGRMFGSDTAYTAVVGRGAETKDRQAAGETKEKVKGDANNGTKVKTQTGVWSSEATRVGNNEAAACGSGAVGVKAEAGGSVKKGAFEADGSAKGAAVIEGRGSAHVDSSSMQIGGDFQSGVSGELKGSAAVGQLKTEATVGAFGGAEATAGAFAGVQTPTAEEKAAGVTSKACVEAKAGAFVGAKAYSSSTISIPGASATAGASVRAGVGAECGASVGITKDDKGRSKLNMGANLGLSVGVGASVNIGANIDVTGVVKMAKGIDKVGCKLLGPFWKFGTRNLGKLVKFAIGNIGRGLKRIFSVFNKIGKIFKKPESKSAKTTMNDYAAKEGKTFKQFKAGVNDEFEKKAEAKKSKNAGKAATAAGT